MHNMNNIKSNKKEILKHIKSLNKLTRKDGNPKDIEIALYFLRRAVTVAVGLYSENKRQRAKIAKIEAKLFELIRAWDVVVESYENIEQMKKGALPESIAVRVAGIVKKINGAASFPIESLPIRISLIRYRHGLYDIIKKHNLPG